MLWDHARGPCPLYVYMLNFFFYIYVGEPCSGTMPEAHAPYMSICYIYVCEPCSGTMPEAHAPHMYVYKQAHAPLHVSVYTQAHAPYTYLYIGRPMPLICIYI